MLSHEDERRLAAIERQMHGDDPGFVRRFRRRATAMPTGHRIADVLPATTLWILAAIGGLVVVTGVVTASATLIMMGLGLTGAAGWLLLLRRRHRAC